MQGSIVAIVTPMLGNGDVDYEAFCRLIHWHIESGTKGIVVCGTTGEAATLTEDEQMTLLSAAVRECRGAIPIIMGTGTFDTASSVRRTRRAKELGASACLVIVPYYSRPSFQGCMEHFSKVAKEGLAVIVYHHPGRTGVRLSPYQLKELCDIDGVIGLKDASADVEACMEFMRISSRALYSGDDLLTLPLIAAGASGSISVVANLLPKKWADFTTSCLAGHFGKAKVAIREMTPLIKALFLTSNPECVKYGMHLMQRCHSTLRLPLLEPGEDVKRQIASAIKSFEETMLSS
jgi:4-hydroxy-tetrahydrodipicolinate synthase